MTLTNRKQAPALVAPVQINLPEPKKWTTSWGSPFYAIEGGREEIILLELIFPAGKWYEKKPGLAAACADMLQEGTEQFTAEEFATEVDDLGAHFKMHSGTDQGKIMISCLSRQFPALLDLIVGLLRAPRFEEEALARYKRNTSNELLQLQGHHEWQCARRFCEGLFGNNHPYGQTVGAKEISAITIEDVRSFYSKHFRVENARFALSGKYQDSDITYIEDSLAKLAQGERLVHRPNYNAPLALEERQLLAVKGAEQSSIIIGRRIPKLGEAHSHEFRILDFMVGGFFGSRLMQKLREEKAYTYNVFSQVVDLESESYWFISSELAGSQAAEAREVIYEELGRLREELASDAEMEILKNYLLGHLLNAVEGPFNQLQQLDELVSVGLGPDYFHNFVAAIHTMDAELLRATANRYLQEKYLFEVIAGDISQF